MSRLGLVVLDVVALALAVFLAFAARAALRHPDLLTLDSLLSFTRGGTAWGAPALLLSFAACGLYAGDWRERGRLAVPAGACWAIALVAFGLAYLGPPDAPRGALLPTGIAVAAGVTAARELARWWAGRSASPAVAGRG